MKFYLSLTMLLLLSSSVRACGEEFFKPENSQPKQEVPSEKVPEKVRDYSNGYRRGTPCGAELYFACAAATIKQIDKVQK